MCDVLCDICVTKETPNFKATPIEKALYRNTSTARTNIEKVSMLQRERGVLDCMVVVLSLQACRVRLP